jgi:hypothetical protein
MPGTVAAYVALGSNLDDPRAQVEHGFEALAGLPLTTLCGRSRLYRTPPWGVTDQPDFVNAAAWLDTALAPGELLRCSKSRRMPAAFVPSRTVHASSTSICCCTAKSNGASRTW